MWLPNFNAPDRTANPYNVLPSLTLTEGVLPHSPMMEQTLNSPIECVLRSLLVPFPLADMHSQTNPTSPRHRPCALKLGPESRHRHVSDPELSANMPISTFVRRKTPTSSPVSPTFAHRTRRRSQSPTINPVSLPTVPPFFAPQTQRINGGSPTSSPSESDDENTVVRRRPERLTPEYSFAEDRHPPISSFSRNNLVQDESPRCVSSLA